MIKIHNKYLSADILDPRDGNDRALMGSRYCTGGYVWQVYDKDGRALLSGPHFPNPIPPVFDGQGMPEVFETPLCGGDGVVGEDVCVIGVGIVKKTSDIIPFHPRNNPDVTRPCVWAIEHGADHVVMTTEQSCRGSAPDPAISSDTKHIRLRREVRLIDNRIESISAIYNIGDTEVDIRWFAHPFFPLNDNLTCGKITPETSSKILLPDNSGYDMDTDGMIRMKPDYPWNKGLFQLLEVPNEKLTFVVPHPIINTVEVCTDYQVIRCPIWANANTFSFEPFMGFVVEPEDKISWGIAAALRPTQ